MATYTKKLTRNPNLHLALTPIMSICLSPGCSNVISMTAEIRAWCAQCIRAGKHLCTPFLFPQAPSMDSIMQQLANLPRPPQHPGDMASLPLNNMAPLPPNNTAPPPPNNMAPPPPNNTAPPPSNNMAAHFFAPSSVRRQILQREKELEKL